MKTKAISVSEMGWFSQLQSVIFTPGKGAHEVDDAAQIEQQQRQNGSQLDHDGVHLPVGVVHGNLHQSFGNAQMRRRADRAETRSSLPQCPAIQTENMGSRSLRGTETHACKKEREGYPRLLPVDSIDGNALI